MSNENVPDFIKKLDEQTKTDGVVDLGRVDIDGFYHTKTAFENKENLQGQMVGHLVLPNKRVKGAVREFILVRLSKFSFTPDYDGIHCNVKDSKTPVKLGIGKVVALEMKADTRDLLDYVANKGYLIAFAPSGKKKLKDGNEMWEFFKRVKGEKGPRPDASLTTAHANDAPNVPEDEMDDIPF